MFIHQMTGLLILLMSQHVAVNSDYTNFFTGEKCIDDLGCFNINYPFFDIIERQIYLFPNNREVINTTFMLFTPRNPDVAINFTNIKGGNVKDILQTSFNPRASMKFVVPGFMSQTSPEWKLILTKALIKSGGSNVFLIDWSGDDGPNYQQAVANTRVVGAEIALFISRLQELTGIDLQSVHIIGHSLGSHIAGYAGKRLKNLGRITALDPAGPYFTKVKPVVRLDRGDAMLVDAIHTNALPFPGLGLNQSIGHFDFYPNGGISQPGCPDIVQGFGSFLKHPTIDAEGLKDMQCDHIRAIKLFISSIENDECELRGVICESLEKYRNGKCGDCNNGSAKPENCVSLGIHVDRYASMIKINESINLYLNTTATEPFCK